MSQRFIPALLLSCALLSVASCERACAEQPDTQADDGRVMLVAKATAREGGQLLFTWKQIEGPAVKIADPTAARLDDKDPNKRRWISETFFIPNEAGTYRFELTVRNEDGQESKKVFEKEVQPPKPAPVAVAGQDQNNRTVGDVIRLNGNDSKAAEGQTLVAWQWEVVQKPPKFNPDPEQLKKAAWDFKAQDAGVYQFVLRVCDNSKRWSVPSAPVAVTVKPLSLPPLIEDENTSEKVRLPDPPPAAVQSPKLLVKPIVRPGRDAKLGETLVLDGTASAIPEGAVHPDFFWHQTDDKGPMVRQLNPDKTQPFDRAREDTNNYPVWTFKPEQPGVYRFSLELTVNANSRDEAKFESEVVTYTVIDTASAAVPPPVAPPPKVEENAGNPPAAVAPVAPPAAPSQLLFAHISSEQTAVDAGELVKLDGSKSTGPEGVKLKFVWGPVAGKLHPHEWTGVDSAQIEFRAEEQGEYGVSLRVTDGEHESAPDQIIITSGPAKAPPTIELPESYETIAGERLSIESHVTDPKGDKVSLKWVCIDPPDLVIKDDKSAKDISTLPSLVFKPKLPGRFVFKLIATDSKGHASSAVTTITVKAAIDRQPTAIIDGPKQPVPVKTKVTLDASRSASPNKLPLTYLWNQESGPTIAGDVPTRKQNHWDFTAREPGRYVVTLEVSDGSNKSPVEKFILEAVPEQHALAARIAGPAAVKFNVDETITLDGSDSGDSADSKAKLQFTWKKLDGAAELKFDGEDQPKLKLTGVSSGPARVQLVVSDGTTESAPAILVVTVGRGKARPVAKITGPETVRAQTPVILSAEGSSGDSEITSWVWTQVSDGGPKIDIKSRDLRKKEIRFEPKLPGKYTFNLVVVDSQGVKSDPAAQSIEVKGVNLPPHAVASATHENNGPILANTEVKLSARGSADPEGAALTYKWKQTAGDPIQLPDATSEIVTLVPTALGKYTFELVVNDGENDSNVAEASFIVEAPHTPPVAVIADIAPVEVKERIVLDGTGSKSSDGGKLEYRWSKVSGPDSAFVKRNGDSMPTTEVLLKQDGEYAFELKVFDGRDWSEPTRATVKTRAPNVAPVAGIVTPNNGRELHTEENLETVLDGSASNDPDNGPRPLTYIWKQLDGPRMELRSEGALARFTPVKLGTLHFQLTVNDGRASSPPAQVAVVVMKAGTLPVAVPDFSPKPAKAASRELKNNVLILDGTKSKPTGKRLAYQWKQTGGDDLHLPPDRMNKDRVGLLVYIPGLYKFSLTVSDDQNTSPPAILEVNVGQDGASAPPAPAPAIAPTPAPAPAPAPETTEKKPDPPAPAPAPLPEATEKKPDPPTTPDGKSPSSSDAGHRDGALLPPPKDAGPAVAKETCETNPDRAAQKQKLDELSKTPGPEAEKSLIDALADPCKEIRRFAAEALYSRGITSIPALIKALDATDANARAEAYHALKELTHETFGPESEKWRDWWAAQPVAHNTGANE